MSRAFRIFALLVAAGLPALGQSIAPEEFSARRARLRDGVGPDALIVVPGRRADDTPEYDGFDRADNTSWYLTGLPTPGHLLVLFPGDGAGSLFVPEGTAVPMDAASARKAGYEAVYWLHELELVLSTRLDEPPARLALPVLARGKPHRRGPPDVEAAVDLVRRTYPKAKVRDVAEDVGALRMVKSPAELAALEKAAAVTNAGQVEAFALAEPGMNEAELEFVFEERWRRSGTPHRAFGSIVGGGVHSTIIHYMDNDAPIPAGSLVVVDVGAEWAGYAADCTRTIPVDGRFTERQREIYDLVLAAHDECVRALKPGVSLFDLHRLAMDRIERAGYGEAFTHYLGHYVGLHVHDTGSFGKPLEPGMVITIEPGIYLEDEALGVRIEDTYVVTADGSRCITEGVPRTAEAIESLAGSLHRGLRRLGLETTFAKGVDDDGMLAPQPEHGLAVDSVEPGSVAEAMGFRPGDVLVELAGRPVGLAGAELEAFLAVDAGASTLLADVLRESRRVALVTVGRDVGSDFPLDAWRSITVAEMKEHVTILAGPEYAGRGTGQEGLEKAAEYVAREFRALGLAPGGEADTYFQPFVLTRQDLAGEPVLSIDGEERTWRQGADFFPFPFGAGGDVAGAPVVFAGYGISAPEAGWDDYAGLDVAGKVVLVLRHAPREGMPDAPSLDPSLGHFETKYRQALGRGAVAFLFVTDPNRHQPPEPVRYGFPAIGRFAADGEDPGVPALYLTNELAERIVQRCGETLSALQSRMDDSLSPVSFEVPGTRVSIHLPLVKGTVEVRNVLGVLPGRDPELRDEVVLLGAHYDHEGIQNGRIFPGADDNASGTTSLIEIAEAFAMLPPEARPRRTICFVAFGAEERGLLGSTWYVRRPVVRVERLACMLNMDMVGRAVDARVAVGAAGLSPVLQAVCERANRLDARLLDLGPPDHSQVSARTDHYPFYRAGVPVLYFKASQNPEYHTPGDTADKVAFGRMERVGRFVFHVAWRAANSDERPAMIPGGPGRQ